MTEQEMLQEALKWQEHIRKLITATDDELYHRRPKVFDWLIEQAEKVEKYREALEFYSDKNHYSDRLYDDKIILLDDGEIARKALEESK